MKRFIVTKQQLVEYVEKKRTDKVFFDIVEHLHRNSKLLKENMSYKKANQSVIDDYNRKNMITPKVQEMLIASKIINENNEIL